jgi:hypothetical protein
MIGSRKQFLTSNGLPLDFDTPQSARFRFSGDHRIRAIAERATAMIDYSHGEYRHCAPVTSMPLLTILGREEGSGSAASAGRGKGTGAAASAGRGEGAGTAARGGCRTGAAANVQQWLVPSQIRCALGNLARASPSVMQAGEPYASDDPIMIATARMGIMRTVIAITLPKKRSPDHLRPGPISTPVSAVLFGDKRPQCQTRALRFRRTMHHRPMPRM